MSLSGVQIGINYGGTVRVLGCAFAGPEAEAIVNEIDMPGDRTALFVCWRCAVGLLQQWLCSGLSLKSGGGEGGRGEIVVTQHLNNALSSTVAVSW